MKKQRIQAIISNAFSENSQLISNRMFTHTHKSSEDAIRMTIK